MARDAYVCLKLCCCCLQYSPLTSNNQQSKMADLSRGQGYHYTEQAHAEGVEHANAKVSCGYISVFTFHLSDHIEQAHAAVVEYAAVNSQPPLIEGRKTALH